MVARVASILLVAMIVLMAKFPVGNSGRARYRRSSGSRVYLLIGLALIILLFPVDSGADPSPTGRGAALLHAVNDTASTVRGTTEFMSHTVVSPIIKFAGFTSAVGQVLGNVRGVVKATRRRDAKRVDTGSKGGNSNGQAG